MVVKKDRIVPQERFLAPVNSPRGNGFCFTDGCGRLSTAFGKRIARSLTIMDPMTCARYRPSTFQIRFKGYKGMVVEDPGLNERDAEVVKMRPSQRKFRFQSGDSGRMGLAFGVVDYSKPYQCLSCLISDAGNRLVASF